MQKVNSTVKSNPTKKAIAPSKFKSKMASNNKEKENHCLVISLLLVSIACQNSMFLSTIIGVVKLNSTCSLFNIMQRQQNSILQQLGQSIMMPSGKGNLHRPIPKGIDLKKILSIRTERTVRNDFTISHDRKLYQIQEAITNKKVIVEEHIDRTMKMIHNGKGVKFRNIQQRPEIKPKEHKIKRRRATTYIPPQDHP